MFLFIILFRIIHKTVQRYNFIMISVAKSDKKMRAGLDFLPLRRFPSQKPIGDCSMSGMNHLCIISVLSPCSIEAVKLSDYLEQVWSRYGVGMERGWLDTWQRFRSDTGVRKNVAFNLFLENLLPLLLFISKIFERILKKYINAVV